MKRNNTLFHLAATLLVAASLGGCINDDSTYGDLASIPSLTIAGQEQEEMPIVNCNLGQEVSIVPDITYSGNDGSLAYHWYVGTYTNGVKGEMELVSEEPTLIYNFERGGVYYAHLTVSDGVVGQAVDYQINVNRTFEQGYVLVSNDAQGNGNLAFVSIPAEEGAEPVVIEHSLETMNEGFESGCLVGFCAASAGGSPTRVVVAGTEKAWCIDPSTFSIISDMDYSEVFPGFKAGTFTNGGNTAPYVYDPAMKKFVHLNLSYLFPYEYSYYVGQSFEDCIYSEYSRWSRLYNTTLYVNYTEPSLAIFYAYASYFGYPSPFISSGDLLQGEKLLSAFYDADYGDGPQPLYALTTSDGDTKAHLYTNVQNMYPEAKYFTKQDLDLTGNEALPEQGTHFLSSFLYKRYFYNVGSRIYTFLTDGTFALPTQSQYAYDFGSGETITAMSINISTEELYVATQNSSDGRGNFYIFNCADLRIDNQANAKPKETYLNCADKITSIVYKPRI